MKKFTLFFCLLLFSLTFTWCLKNWWNTDDNEWGWEWITVVTDMCEEEWWVIEEWNEGWEKQEVCFYPDESFCYLENLASNDCHIWDMYYGENDYDYSVYAEQACIDSNWQLSETGEGYEICIIDDDNYCYIDEILNDECTWVVYNVQDIIAIHEGERAYQEYVAECYEQEQITVCWQDGNPYYNRCFMEKAWVEEETELAEVVDWECIYW